MCKTSCDYCERRGEILGGASLELHQDHMCIPAVSLLLEVRGVSGASLWGKHTVGLQ